ncbi:hypothetical protein OG618_37875 (plasmid) [Kitasatospora sp. NBC_01246]|uniref:hypothetical protein n=1 Tax=Kitasatospora sp. NBC_01246 TaxID=2903570 RepID=UPI002E3398F7|nr:hypothetical protein [Kitasatospora sp. NBC_01246]
MNSFAVNTRVSRRAANPETPDYGVIRLIITRPVTVFGPHVSYLVEWDRQQGRTFRYEAASLALVPEQAAPQVIPGIDVGVRVEGVTTYQGPDADSVARSILRRGKYTGPRYTHHTVLWDGEREPEMVDRCDFWAAVPGAVRFERARQGGFAVGDVAEAVRDGGTVSGRVLEILPGAGKCVRVAWVGQDGSQWHGADELYPLHGAQLAQEYERRMRGGQTHEQASSVYLGDYRPITDLAVRAYGYILPLDR